MFNEENPEYFNRHGRRSEVARIRKAPAFARKYNARLHADRQREARKEGLAYRIAKIRRDWPVIKAFQKKHKKLKKQFAIENKKLA